MNQNEMIELIQANALNSGSKELTYQQALSILLRHKELESESNLMYNTYIKRMHQQMEICWGK